MATSIGIAVVCSWLFFTCVVQAQTGPIDITTLGAKPDGDISQALADAWKQACASPTATTIVIPKGNFLLTAANLEGPCTSPVEIQVQGTVKAPEDPAQIKAGDEWIMINKVNGFTLSGSGVFDGQGAAKAWTQNNCKEKLSGCSKLPNNFAFNFLSNTVIRDITSLNSKMFHVNVLSCSNITFQHFTVTAPGDSPNTDGIHIGRSTGVTITDTTIGTGDDCISIGDGSVQVNISNVKCGPGHGISIGSLGLYDNEQPVDGVFVNDCTITNTLNGVRVKSWPAAKAGSAVNMHFEGIIMENVSNPVVIDQEYCPNNQCSKSAPSKVKISKVSFKNITGTAATQPLVSLICSESIPCEGVEVADIDLKYTGPALPAANVTVCAHVQPVLSGKLNPSICAAPAAAA